MTDGNDTTDMSRMIALIRQVTSYAPYPGEILASTRYVEDLAMESMNQVMLVTLVEQEFGVDLESQMQSLVEQKTVGDTVAFVVALKNRPQ